MQLCWESLLPMREEDDPMGKAQAWLFMTSASCFTHNIVRAKVFIKRCLDTVKRNGIRFLPHSDEISSDTLELTEENHERVVFLGQLLYWLVYLYLVDGHVEDAMHDLERQFRFELPVSEIVGWMECDSWCLVVCLSGAFQDMSDHFTGGEYDICEGCE